MKNSTKNKVIDTPVVENISTQSLDLLMGDRYGVYAKYVIQDRAIPDARDGLKPVQRRIIFSMYRSGNLYEKPTRKCAKIVGDVMGTFHPHGDTSIYDALVRLSQPWKMRVPLIFFQGNNGSIDDDPPAAYRYTEAKLNEVTTYLIKDIDKNTVDMTLNFSDTDLEPTVLPCRFPNLLVNGSDGIAVAIATQIPPHNLIEMCDATIYRINHPRCSIDELLDIIKGPDFPTGGNIYKSSGIREIYETGKGKIDIVSKVNIVENKDSNDLVISEIPYGVIKQKLVYSIDNIRKSKEVDGIISVLDLSANNEIKIIVSIKKEINPQIILTYLFNKTQLKVSYSANMMAICKQHPRILTLTSYLDTYIDHQVEVITRRSKYDLEKAKARLNILEGLVKAINVVDEVVKIIRASKDKQDAKTNLKNKYGFNEEQAEAIVMMRLYKLSNADINIYLNEISDIKATIADLEETLASPSKLRKIICSDLKEIEKKYGTNRKTAIIEQEENEVEISKRDLITKEDVYVCITRDGYFKRSSLKSVKASNDSLPGLKDGDTIVISTICSTLDYILIFTNCGNYICMPVHEIIESKWKDEGKHMNTVCNLPISEMIIKCIVVSNFNKKVNIATVSKYGQIKKSALNDFYCSRFNKPIQCMRLLKDDELVDVSVCNGNSDILVSTKNGNCTFFNENELAIQGLKTSGVKSISSLKNNEVVGLLSFRKDDKNKLIAFTNKGAVRIYDPSNLVLTSRLGRMQSIFRYFKSDPHELVYINKIVNKNEPFKLYASLSDGTIYHTDISDFHLTPIEKNCKKSLDFADNLTIKHIFIDSVQKISDKTIEEISPNSETKNNNFILEIESDKKDDKEKNNKRYEQISIFDDLGD